MIIYAATNMLNNKKYIGQTCRSLTTRKNHHIRSSLLKRYDTHFHRALLKHGQETFVWEIIDHCNTRDELNEKEIYYISKFDTFSNGYNMSLGGLGCSNVGGKTHPMYGKQHSDETKQKLREFNLGKKLSNITKKKIGMARKGTSLSEETKNKISETQKGKDISEETRAKISETKKGTMTGKQNPFYGKKHSKELQDRITNKISLDWVVEFPNGKKEKIRNLKCFCVANSITQQRMYDVAAGKIEHHNLFKCEKIT